MTEVRVIVDTDTIRPGRIGPATGDIWLSLGESAFPMEGWNDFVVVILGWWAGGIVRLLAAESERENFDFMDGPYTVEATRLSGHGLRLQAIERGRDARVNVTMEARILPLAESILAESERVLTSCRHRGCWSADADTLDELVRVLRTGIEEARRRLR